MKAKNWFSLSFFKNTLVYQRNLNFKICVKSSLVYTPFPDIILRIPVFLSKISPKSDFIRNHSYFFYFWTWISLIFLKFWVVFTNLLAGKFETLVVFMKFENKKIETHLAPRLGPRTSAPALGPSLGARWVSIFLFRNFMKPPKFQISCQKIRETTQNSKKSNETR